jgi:signal transduction histidine kinase
LDSSATVSIDGDRMRRAFLNLFQNAFEAMPDGGQLVVESRRVDESVCVRVVDSGQGIPEAIRSRVFEPFVTSGKRGGSGLGLAIVKKIVDDHAGSISVAKAEGGGAVFEVRLPLYLPNENA